MKSKWVRVSVFVVGLVMTRSLRADEGVEALQKKIEEKWSKVDSMSAKMRMNMNMKSDQPIKSDGTVEFLRDGGKEKLRMEMVFEQKLPGQEMKVLTTTIYDGEFVYSVTDMMGQKMATKQKPHVLQGTPDLKENHELKVLPDEKVDGQDALVLEAKPKSQSGVTAMKMYFSKDTGMLIKTVGVDEKGEPVMDIVYTDVKLNPKLDAARFSYKTEPGVQVMDMTTQ
jgi:outer membrane lipoprotein-sorting protein